MIGASARKDLNKSSRPSGVPFDIGYSPVKSLPQRRLPLDLPDPGMLITRGEDTLKAALH